MNVFKGKSGRWENSDRFDRFTERGRAVFRYAQGEAHERGHTYIGTEHLLLGLQRDPQCIAAQALENLGASREKVRQAVEFIVGSRQQKTTGEVGLTPRAKKVMELATDEARRLHHHYVGTEHLLLGMVREGEGIAARVLTDFGATLGNVRAQVIQVLSSGPIPPEDERGTATEREPATAAQAPVRESGGVKSNVVTCRLDDASLGALDALVEAGVRSTRSDAAAWLIAAGIESHRALFERVNTTVGEIRRLRTEARSLAEQVIAEGADRQEPQSPDEPDAAEPTPEE